MAARNGASSRRWSMLLDRKEIIVAVRMKTRAILQRGRWDRRRRRRRRRRREEQKREWARGEMKPKKKLRHRHHLRHHSRQTQSPSLPPSLPPPQIEVPKDVPSFFIRILGLAFVLHFFWDLDPWCRIWGQIQVPKEVPSFFVQILGLECVRPILLGLGSMVQEVRNKSRSEKKSLLSLYGFWDLNSSSTYFGTWIYSAGSEEKNPGLKRSPFFLCMDSETWIRPPLILGPESIVQEVRKKSRSEKKSLLSLYGFWDLNSSSTYFGTWISSAGSEDKSKFQNLFQEGTSLETWICGGGTGEREVCSQEGLHFFLGPPSQPKSQKKELDWTSFFLRFGFVVEGRRDGTSFGIKEMKWNPKRNEAQSKSQKKWGRDFFWDLDL